MKSYSENSSSRFLELQENQLRQLSDCTAVWRNFELARQEAEQVRGSMRWRTISGKRYLIRVSPRGGETSLGPEDSDKKLVYERFHERKQQATQRLATMKQSLQEHQRINRALRLGRTPAIVVRCLGALDAHGLSRDFLVVGTHALYAYELAAGVRVESGATATLDLDLLFDVNRMRAYSAVLAKEGAKSLIQVIKKADPTFRVKRDQLHTAVNDGGFEVDIVRRYQTPNDPHPLRMSQDEDDFWAVQVSQGQAMASARRFEHLVIAASGQMALMRTLHPLDFIRLKKQLAELPGRDPLKAPKDKLQAQVVEHLWEEYLRHAEPV
jgi:hypothetical protein